MAGCPQCGADDGGAEHQCASARRSEMATRSLPLGPGSRPLALRPSVQDLPAGTRVGDYEIVEKIGEGGMGTVYRAEHPLIGKQVAIKCLERTLARNEDILRRFILEAQAVNKIGHHNIVDIFSFGQLDDGQPYLVMEYLSGETLRARSRRDPPLQLGEVLAILRQVCAGLGAAHDAGFVHRDLKPDNIMLVDAKGGVLVKLLDFGIAKLVSGQSDAQSTRSGLSLGTPTYMSPEQCLSAAIDRRSDIYSLGVILFVLVTGQPPFRGGSDFEVHSAHVSRRPPDPRTLAPVPDALAALILACLEKDPARRPASVAEVESRLDAFAGADLAGLALPRAMATAPHARATPPSSPAPSPAAASSSGTRVRVLLALAALGGLGVGVASRYWRRAAVVPAPSVAIVAAPPSAAAGVTPDVPAPEPRVAVSATAAHAVAADVAAAGRLELHVDGARARFFLDGAAVGSGAELSLDHVAAGSHRLRAAAAGFHAREADVVVHAGEPISLHWKLRRLPARKGDIEDTDALVGFPATR